MRCKNCGWPNKSGATVCTKCKTKLEDSDLLDAESTELGLPLPPTPENSTIYESDPSTPQNNNTPSGAGLDLGRTIYENPDDPTPTPAQPSSPKAKTPSECPKCGYPLRPGALQCPECKASLVTPPTPPQPRKSEIKTPSECPNCGYPLRPGTLRCPGCNFVIGMNIGEPIPDSHEGKTVPPGSIQKKPEESDGPAINNNPPRFRLELVPGENERLTRPECEFVGLSVVLNRSNTEPNNCTITSKQQAVIAFDGSRWTIQDHSSLQTTYVRATKPIEIHDGDVILLGDRQFIFHV